MFRYRLIDKLNLKDEFPMDFGEVFEKEGCLSIWTVSAFSYNHPSTPMFRYGLIDKLNFEDDIAMDFGDVFIF